MVIKRASPFTKPLNRRLGGINTLIILLALTACQNTATPLPVVTVPPSAVAAIVTLAATHTPPLINSLIDGMRSQPAPPSATLAAPLAFPTIPISAPPESSIVIGASVEGRPLTVYRFGSGDRIVLLIGGIHGGWESNTVTLVEQLITHFRTHPGDILPDVAIHLIPVANPDELAMGTRANARYNAHDIDLNRNWACDWSREAWWRDVRVNAGSAPMSEPETQAIAGYVLEMRPAVVLFYHSQAGGVYSGDCRGSTTSHEMSALYGESAGYTFGQAFSAYPVTGTASAWVDGLGIPSADVELATHDQPEFEVNLRAVMAIQAWVMGG